MSNARKILDSMWDDSSGEEWKNNDDEKSNGFPSNYSQPRTNYQQHPLESAYEHYTDGEIADILEETVQRVAGLVPRGEAPDMKVRYFLLSAIEDADKVLKIVDDLAP